jgi:hypothetical protein
MSSYKVSNGLQLVGSNNFTFAPTSGELNISTDTVSNAVKIKNSGEIVTRGNLTVTDGTYNLSISIPPGISGNINLILPISTGTSGQVLSSTGSATTWITPYTDTTTTIGDIPYRNASNVLTRLPIGSTNQRLVTRDGVPTWRQQFEPARELSFYDEFTSTSSPFGDFGWLLFVAATSVNSTLPTGATTGFGVSRFLFSGATSYGAIGRNTSSGLYIQANSTLTFEAMIWIESLASVAEQYILRVGFGDVFTSSTDMSNGIYLEYNIATSANWLGRTSSGGSRSTVTSSIPVAAGSWVRCGFTATSSSVSFFINGTNIGSTASNIPTTSSNRASPTFRAARSAGASIVAYAFVIDYVYYHMSFSSDRY